MIKNFLKKHRVHLIALAVFILIAVGSNWYLTLQHYNTTTQPASTSTGEIPAGRQYSNITRLRPPMADYDGQAIQPPYDEPSTERQLEKIFIQVNDKNYDLPYSPSTTFYEAMQILTADSRIPFLFTAKEFSGMGYFVDEINGVKNNNQTGEYWIYYVNNKSATVGISQYILKPGDKIEWKYEKAKF